jgi:hypothetical protein
MFFTASAHQQAAALYAVGAAAEQWPTFVIMPVKVMQLLQLLTVSLENRKTETGFGNPACRVSIVYFLTCAYTFSMKMSEHVWS